MADPVFRIFFILALSAYVNVSNVYVTGHSQGRCTANFVPLQFALL